MSYNGFDANGNTLTKSNSSGTTTYGWDFENRLTSAVVPAVGTTTFRYDPFGRRIQKAGPNGTTNYVYDGPSTIEEIDGSGNLLAHYAQGARIDEPLGELRSGTSAFYEQDGLGSVTSLSSSTARDLDSETGLRYYRARYYLPESGRFLSEDSLEFRAGINFYQYVFNNPINSYDPTGACTIYIFFEPPRGFWPYEHAFIVMFDTNPQNRIRPWEFRAGPAEFDPNRLSSTFGPILGGGARGPTDDPAGADNSVTLLNNNCSCAPNWEKLDQLNAFISQSNIRYDYMKTNSNSVITTAIDLMGLPRPTLPVSPWRVPGWGNPLPGWPPQGGGRGR